jgi:class 3 adenylate cyclase
MLARMSEGARDTPALNWSDLGVSELLPTGTVTLLLADVEGSTRLWETQPEEMNGRHRAAGLHRVRGHRRP